MNLLIGILIYFKYGYTIQTLMQVLQEANSYWQNSGLYVNLFMSSLNTTLMVDGCSNSLREH